MGVFYGTSIRRNKLNGIETIFFEWSAYVLKDFGLGTPQVGLSQVVEEADDARRMDM